MSEVILKGVNTVMERAVRLSYGTLWAANTDYYAPLNVYISQGSKVNLLTFSVARDGLNLEEHTSILLLVDLLSLCIYVYANLLYAQKTWMIYHFCCVVQKIKCTINHTARNTISHNAMHLIFHDQCDKWTGVLYNFQF